MAASSKTVKKAEQQRISSIGDIKKRMGGIQELPSGLVVRIKNPGGLKAFLSGGEIPNSLMSIIKESMDEGKAPEVNDFLKDGKLDQQMLDDMNVMLDNMVPNVVVEPKVFRTLTQEDLDEANKSRDAEHQLTDVEELRQDDRLYADEIPLDDKMFLFQWVSGGTRDLEKFREEQARGLDTVVEVTSPVRDAQQRAGIDPR